MQVMVIGGGISGLALAMSLHQVGVPVRVYEAARRVTPLGVGINLQPNAVRELTELGLGDALAGLGTATQALCFFNKFGTSVWQEKRGRAAGFNWPQYSIHRGKLQVMLAEAARARIGDDNLRTGHSLQKFEQRGDKVVAWFIDRRTGETTVSDEADILVGADGIHSAVRRQLYPAEGEPNFAGQVLWRAAVAAEPFSGGATMVVAGHFHQRVIAYPMGPAPGGKLLTNWIAQMSVTDEAPPREDWNRKVAKERFCDAFRDWKFPFLDFPRLIADTAEIFEFPLVDRHPVEQWSFGRVTLIGDAAHPTQPTGSQAGSQAIVDARMLTAELLATADPVAALANYDRVRRPPMNDITLRNRNFGPEAAMQLAEERAPGGFDKIEDVIPRAELEEISRSFQMIVGLDPATLNARPSFVKR